MFSTKLLIINVIVNSYHIFGTTFKHFYHIFGTTFCHCHHIFWTTFG